MHAAELLALVLGASWMSGIRLYATLFLLGLADRADWITLPGNLSILAHPVILVITGVLCVAEVLADKFPIVDSAIDTFNTAIKPIGGGILAYLAAADAPQFMQVAVGLVGGGITLTTHAVKTSARAAMNVSPEPVTNIATSTAEDGITLAGFWLLLTNPWILAILVVLFLVFAVWFLRKMWRFVGRLCWRNPPNEQTTGARPGTSPHRPPSETQKTPAP